jgi:hypothetical protein
MTDRNEHFLLVERFQWYFIVIIALSLVAILFFSSGLILKQKSIEAAEVKLWGARIASVGAEEAHKEFAQSIEGKSVGEQHDRAHYFGKALYNSSDASIENPIVVCDSRFSYGCLHEYIANIVVEKGLSAMVEVSKGCSEQEEFLNRRGCYHGVGHGVLLALGYELDDLHGALQTCDSFSSGSSTEACYGGIFMEFNLRSGLADESEIRPLSDGVATLCTAVAPEYIEQCVYRLPQWWFELLYRKDDMTREAMFESIGDYCRNGDITAEDQKHCFWGIGHFGVFDGSYEHEYIDELCSAAAKSEPEKQTCVQSAKERLDNYR